MTAPINQSCLGLGFLYWYVCLKHAYDTNFYYYKLKTDSLSHMENESARAKCEQSPRTFNRLRFSKSGI